MQVLNRHVVVGLIALVAILGSGAPVASADLGYEGASFSGTSTPTGTKRAESVLWFNDGDWWAHMWSPASSQFHIFRLDEPTHTWVDTGVTTDPRSGTHADVLWDGAHLYVASHEFVSDGQSATSGKPSYLYRFSYNPLTRQYALDSGFPAVINSMKTETLVIDKDSTGKLWATWQQGNRIYMNRTIGDDASWGTPFALPVVGSDVTVDDNSAVVAFAGKIGVMWSNQSNGPDAMYFAVHEDGRPDTEWQGSRTAIQGDGTADDHISLKSLQADSGGRVLAAIKTELSGSESPLIMVLARDPATGDWTSHPVARVSECPNRPLLLIDEENRRLHVFSTYPAPPDYSCTSSGGEIREKVSPLDEISFPTGPGTTVLRDSDSPYVHNVNSTKQNVNSATGMVVLAANGRTQRYWHAEQALPSAEPQPPVASFEYATTSDPLTLQFKDTSTGTPDAWAWDFGDGQVSTRQHPSHAYAEAGTYSVSLTVSNALGMSTATRDVTVTSPPPDFTLSAAPSSRSVVRGSSTSYELTVEPVHGFSGSVEFAVSGLPSGASAKVDPNPLTVSGGPAAATLAVATDAQTKQGSYTLTVTARAGELSHTAQVSLQVKRK